MLLLALIATSYCCCDSLLPFSMKTLSRQYFVHSSNSYVATSIIMSQHSFSAASANWCRDPSFHVATTSLFRLCCNTVLYYLHFCRDRGWLPISLTSCCSFVLMLRHDFCDAPKPRGSVDYPSTAEYKWMSGYPTPLQKIGQSLLCTGSSTQIKHLHETCPK